jgi:hypothetical protein
MAIPRTALQSSEAGQALTEAVVTKTGPSGRARVTSSRISGTGATMQERPSASPGGNGSAETEGGWRDEGYRTKHTVRGV